MCLGNSFLGVAIESTDARSHCRTFRVAPVSPRVLLMSAAACCPRSRLRHDGCTLGGEGFRCLKAKSAVGSGDEDAFVSAIGHLIGSPGGGHNQISEHVILPS